MEPGYEAIHKHTCNNLEEVRASTRAVCLYCKRIIYTAALFRDHPMEDICRACDLEYTKEGTVFCQNCGIDSVIGDASGLPVTSPEFVDNLHDWAFRASCAVS